MEMTLSMLIDTSEVQPLKAEWARLVTSAGTYVKEFVHGDRGRTQPSVKGMLGCRADIMQLDVTWLFDDYEGGSKKGFGGVARAGRPHLSIAEIDSPAGQGQGEKEDARTGSNLAGADVCLEQDRLRWRG